jgi:hypothetical protein
MRRTYSLLFLLFIGSIFHSALAQVGQSPYTVKGIGAINSMATARNMGMGGIGIGNSHYLYLNNMNPAMLTRNNFYTTFEAGMSLESRNFTTLEDESRATSGGLDYLSVAFPIIYDRLTFNAGIAPYSTVNYNMATVQPIVGAPGSSRTTFRGAGGTTQAYAATGVKLFKGISAGIRASYIFGAITEEITTSIQGAEGTAGSGAFPARFYDQTSFSDVLFTGGLAYRGKLPGTENNFIMAGLTYDMETNLNATRYSTIERALNANPATYSGDTLKGTYFLPASIGTGLSFEKLYHYTLAADVKWQNWEDYRGIEGTTGDLGESYRVALGGEWTPDYSSAQQGTYYKRMTYRMGLQYEKTPFVFNGEDINDFGINFGVTLPVSNASSIHTSFLFGQRGKNENDLIRERYFRVSLGITFNDRWFTKVKYD